MSILKKIRYVCLSSVLIATPLLSSCEWPTEEAKSKDKISKRENSSTIESYVTELTKDNFYKTIQESKLPIVVDFYAPWCHYCILAEPYYNQLSVRFKGKVRFFKYDIDKDSTIPRKYDISGIPTFLFFYKGKVVDKVVGYDIESLTKKVEEASKRK